MKSYWTGPGQQKQAAAPKAQPAVITPKATAAPKSTQPKTAPTPKDSARATVDALRGMYAVKAPKRSGIAQSLAGLVQGTPLEKAGAALAASGGADRDLDAFTVKLAETSGADLDVMLDSIGVKNTFPAYARRRIINGASRASRRTGGENYTFVKSKNRGAA